METIDPNSEEGKALDTLLQDNLTPGQSNEGKDIAYLSVYGFLILFQEGKPMRRYRLVEC